MMGLPTVTVRGRASTLTPAKPLPICICQGCQGVRSDFIFAVISPRGNKADSIFLFIYLSMTSLTSLTKIYRKPFYSVRGVYEVSGMKTGGNVLNKMVNTRHLFTYSNVVPVACSRRKWRVEVIRQHYQAGH